MRGFESRLRRLEGGGVRPLCEEARAVLLKSNAACEPGTTLRHCVACGREVRPTVVDMDKLLELEVRVVRGFQRRLGTVEARHTSVLGGFSDWPLEDQAEDVLGALKVHRAGGTRRLATDREIRHGVRVRCGRAWEEGGEHTFPSGSAVALMPDDSDDGFHGEAPSLIRVEALPEGAREYRERMYPDEQPTRERWLCEHRRSAQEIRGRRTSVTRFPRTDQGEGGSY